jgi:predicted DNA-binding protein
MKKIISVSLDEEQVKKIEDVCRISERTKSWLVKKAVDNYLEDLNDMETALERSLTEDKDLLTEKQLRRSLKN